MDTSVLRFVVFSSYAIALFVGIGVLTWLITRKSRSTLKQYSMVFAFLILFPTFIPNIMWNSWSIHLLFPLVYLLFIKIFREEKISNFHESIRLHLTSLPLALGVFFTYAFTSMMWSYFPVQSFITTVFQSISIIFTYLIFKRIQHTRAEIFTPSGDLARLCLTVGIGSFVLLLFVNDIMTGVYSSALSLSQEGFDGNQTISKYLTILTKHGIHQAFFDSGFTFFSVIAFPLAMLMHGRKASLLLLGGFFLAVLFISESQAALLGLLCGICMVLFLPRLPMWMQQSMPWVMFGSIAIFPFFTLLIPATLEIFNYTFIKESEFFVKSFEPRLWIYRNTVFLDIWTHPWFGHGINTVNLDIRESTSIFNIFFAASSYTHPHNHTLTLLIELGITGLLLFLWLSACILRNIKSLEKQHQPYALGAFFSALCLTTFTQPLWGISLIIWCSAFLMFALFGRSRSQINSSKN